MTVSTNKLSHFSRNMPAAASNMRGDLSSLDIYIVTLNSDIEKKKYSKINYKVLTEIFERCNNMLSNLFKGYPVSGDKKN